jgi:hypothetical protein
LRILIEHISHEHSSGFHPTLEKLSILLSHNDTTRFRPKSTMRPPTQHQLSIAQTRSSIYGVDQGTSSRSMPALCCWKADKVLATPQSSLTSQKSLTASIKDPRLTGMRLVTQGTVSKEPATTREHLAMHVPPSANPIFKADVPTARTQLEFSRMQTPAVPLKRDLPHPIRVEGRTTMRSVTQP